MLQNFEKFEVEKSKKIIMAQVMSDFGETTSERTGVLIIR